MCPESKARAHVVASKSIISQYIPQWKGLLQLEYTHEKDLGILKCFQ